MNIKNDYIKGIKEWQEYQYNPGHYTSGNIPFWLKYPGKKKNLLISITILAGFFYFILTILTFTKTL